MPRFTGPLVTKDTSRGVVVRALFNALSDMLQDARTVERKARIRGHLDALIKAYPFELVATESDVDQALAEEDGDAISEGP